MITALKEKINTAIAKALECMARDPKRAERLLGDAKKWVGELAQAIATQGAAGKPPSRDWKAIEKAIDEYLDGYELRLDEGSHSPTEFERFLINDAIGGLLAENEFLSLMNAAPKTSAETRDAALEEAAVFSAAYVRKFGPGGAATAIRALKSAPAAEDSAKGAVDVVAWTNYAGDIEPISDAVKQARPDLYAKHYTRPLAFADRQQRGRDDFSGAQPPMRHIAGVSVDVLRRAALAAQPAATPAPLQEQTVPSDEVPLPADLLDLIGQYGAARQDSRSDTYALHCWQRLIQGIKQYARHGAQPAASAEPWKPLWEDIMAVAESAGTPTAAQMKEWAWRLRRCAAHKPDGGDAKDAERWRWLTDDHNDPRVRVELRALFDRLPVMSYSAACAAVDAAMAQQRQGEGDH